MRPSRACDTAADDVCLISFTSGTTGVPKGTMHMHRDVLAICDCFPRSMLQVRADDIFIGTPPLAFTFGLGGLLLFPLRFGAATVLLEKLTPDGLLRAIGAYQATICFTAPTFYRQMAPLARQHDLRSLRLSVSAGEALPLATRDAWQAATGLAMTDGIGATEMLHIFISATGEGIRRGAIGKADSRLPGLHRRRRGRAAAARRDGPPGGERPDRLPLPVRPAPARLRAERLEPDGRRLRDGCRRLFLLPLAQRRHDRLGRLQHRRPGSGRCAAAPSGRGRMRRGRARR